jgi:RNA-splicing ligase RtcB
MGEWEHFAHGADIGIRRCGALWAVERGYGSTAELEHIEEKGCIAHASPARFFPCARDTRIRAGA